MPAPRNALSRNLAAALSQGQGQTAGPYQPSWREKLARHFVPDDGLVPLEREKMLKQILGSTGTGADRSGGDFDYIPGVGQVMLGVDAMEALSNGNVGRTAGSALEMAIPAGIGRLVAGGARVASKGVKNTLQKAWKNNWDKAAPSGEMGAGKAGAIFGAGVAGGTVPYGMWLLNELLKNREPALTNRDRMK